MASFHFANGDIVNSPQTLSDGQSGLIDAGGGLEVAATGSKNIVAITWTGGTTEIDNSGIISATAVTGDSRGIDTGKNSLADGSSLTFNNYAGASLTSLTIDAIRINADIVGGTILVDNYGTIVSGSVDLMGNISGTTSGQALDFDNVHSSTVTINNYAGGLIGAADADAIRPGGNATINNWGRIAAQNGAGDSGNDGIDFQSNAGGGIVNNYAGGTIDGARHGITGDYQITVNNWGSITGHLGSGINMDTPSLSMTDVTNYGTIVGTGGYLGGDPNQPVDGDGIDVDGLLTLDNFGTVQATGVHVIDPAASGGIDIQEAVTIGGGSITNEAGGVITSFERAITVNDSDGSGGPGSNNGDNGGNGFAPTTIDNWGLIQGGDYGAISITDTYADAITNHGTIEGSIVLTSGVDPITGDPSNSGNDTIANYGTIDGSVTMGNGDDTLNDYTGSTFNGAIDGGNGSDVVNLLGTGTGTGTLADVTNFETLHVQGGTWSLTDAESFANGTSVNSGAALYLGNGGTAGSLGDSITDNGVFGVDRSDAFTFSDSITGTGSFDQAGTGTTALTTTNDFTGGVTLHAGTLDLAAFDAAGTGAITFEAGAQILKVEKAALDSGHLDNTIDGFAAGDTIDLAGIGHATHATLSAANVLSISGGGALPVSLQLDAHAYGSGDVFHLSSDGQGGTDITVSSDNIVQGNDRNNLLIADLFSPVGSFLIGNGGNDILIGGPHNDVLMGGGGDDLLYGGSGADVFRFNGTDEGAGQHGNDDVFDLNFGKGDSLAFYDYAAGSFASNHGAATSLDTGEGAGSAAVVQSMAGLVDLVNSSADLSAHHGGLFGNDLVLDISQTNGGHESIALANEWHAYASAANASHVML